MGHFPILSALIWWPIAAAVVILVVSDVNQGRLTKVIAMMASLVELLMCVPLVLHFNTETAAMQFTERLSWIKAYGIHYALGVDGISLVMIILTAFTTWVVVMAGFRLIKQHLAQYMAAFLVSQGIMVGIFAATDAVLFYVFWEAILIPIYLSIGIWGGDNRSYAAMKFFLYTFLGSIFMLLALMYLHVKTGSFDIQHFYGLDLSAREQLWLFLAFFAAFAVKVPLWPFHTWLPDAHTEAPAGGSVVLAALMLKLGIYGFVRFSMPIAHTANQYLDGLMIALALIAIIYIGIVAIVQTDFKKLIAYSSIAHMGIAVLGCYMVYGIIAVAHNYQDAYLSMEGAVVQMVSHAFSTGAMFLAVGMIQYRIGSRAIKDCGGIAKSMPCLAAFFMLFSMANVGLPGTSGFVGEFMVIVSAFQANVWIALAAASTLVLAAAYTLWMYKRVFFGPVQSQQIAELQDISYFECFIFAVLALPVLWLGVYPQALLHVLHASVGHLLHESLMFNPIHHLG